MRNRAGAFLLLGWIILVPPLSALATPSTAPLCSNQEYRQTHLRECNLGSNPGLGVGAGGGGGGGLLGAIGNLIGSIL